MCAILDINPRLKATRQSNLSTLHNGCINSDNALKLINECLRRLDKKIERILEREDD